MAKDVRGQEMQAANELLLSQLCQAGDFLSSRVRRLVVRESLEATVACAACERLQSEQPKTWEAFRDAPHELKNDCLGLGSVVHALANTQNLLDEAWYQKASEHVWEALCKVGEVKVEKDPMEVSYRFTELIACVALAVGHRAFYRALGKDPILEKPPLPAPAEAAAAKFESAREVTGLTKKKDCGWGPCLDGSRLTAGLRLANGVPRWRSFQL